MPRVPTDKKGMQEMLDMIKDMKKFVRSVKAGSRFNFAARAESASTNVSKRAGALILKMAEALKAGKMDKVMKCKQEIKEILDKKLETIKARKSASKAAPVKAKKTAAKKKSKKTAAKKASKKSAKKKAASKKAAKKSKKAAKKGAKKTKRSSSVKSGGFMNPYAAFGGYANANNEYAESDLGI